MNEKIINKLFELAQKSYENNEFPVSAIIFKDDTIISTGYNKRNKSKMTCDHAEIIAINRANKKTHDWRLNGYSMLVTLEPCDMCKTVIKEARLDKVYYFVPRYNYKKQYKNTVFIEKDESNTLVDEYINKINSFFRSKR